MNYEKNFNRINVSIVIPTFNRKGTLRKTLDSLFNQTFPQENFEIIIVDDGSTDDTEEFIEEIKGFHKNLCYFKQRNKGAASARNLGIFNAKGEIIGFTDDDCIVSPTWIEYGVKLLQDFEFCGSQGITLPQKEIQTRNKIFNYLDVVIHTGKEKYPSYPTCNIFYRKKILIEESGFDEKMGSLTEDDDLAYRLIKKGYKINFNRNMIVYHEVRYINILEYVLKRLKRIESKPLFIKKHPEFRKNLFLKIFIPSHVYIILAIGTFVFYLFNLDATIPLFFTIFSFLVTRVFIDKNYMMMPVRIALFWRYFIIDFAGVYYYVKGSIKHRSLLI